MKNLLLESGMKQNIAFMLLSILLTVSPLWSQADIADEVTFVNGDRLTGQIKGHNGEVVVFTSKLAGQIMIPIDQIREIRHGGTIVPNPSRIQLADNACKWRAVDRDGIPQLSWWRIGVSTGQGLSWVYATQGQQSLGGTLALGLCEGNSLNNTTLELGGTHTRSSKIGAPAITGDVADGELVQKHMFKDINGFGVYGIGDAFLNNSLGLVLQKSFGVGLLLPQGTYKSISYSAMADVRYINQRFYGIADSTNLAGMRLEENAQYTRKAFGVNEEFWIIPAFNDVHALQMFARGGPSVNVSPWLCISINEEEHYLGDAPPGKRKNYLASTVKLALQHKDSACK
jgi:hypothetical protein